VTESTEQGEVAVDVYQKLSDDRILFISDFVDDRLATDITANLLLKDSEDQNEKITLFINSGGGDIRNVFMIYDMMKMIHAPIETVCIGAAIDEAIILLSAGTKGMRYSTRNSVICVGPLESDHTSYSDLTNAKLSLNQSLDDNKRMMEAIAKATGKKLKEVMSDFQRKVFMNASQAVKYNLIDKIVGK
jgi:ATP-dependent Clp protease protease subunit